MTMRHVGRPQFEGRELAQLVQAEEGARDCARADAPREGLRGEYWNLALLMVLYTLQGVPMGFAAVMPLFLKQRGASFSDVGTFSLNSWPFSLKLLWAPIVDAVYIRSLGRRKTWLVPAQLVIGVVMLAMSLQLDLWLERLEIGRLTAAFLLLHFLCATQDIAVDGWAITMLQLENVGYASTCNSAGQTLGYFLSFTGFMVLEHFKLVTLPGFMAFMGAVFIACTIAVAVFKRESPCRPEEEPPDVQNAYMQLFKMTRSIPIRTLAVVLVTWKIPFAASDAVAPLKFQEYGMPKEHMAYLASLIMPVQILMPLAVARRTTGQTPMDLAMAVYPWRILLTLVVAVLVWKTPQPMDPIPWGFYGLLLALMVVQSVCSSAMFSSQMGFFARVAKSTPELSGTYMTVLNTLANLGGMWTVTGTFFAVDLLGCKGPRCAWGQRDGYYVMSLVGVAFGAGWLWAGMPHVGQLQGRQLQDWKVK